MENQQFDKNVILFGNLVLMFKSAALQHMGKITDPVTGKIHRDLQQASFSIDILDMLVEKCHGNLSTDEEQFISHTISELKLNYVDECQRQPEAKDMSEGGKRDDSSHESSDTHVKPNPDQDVAVEGTAKRKDAPLGKGDAAAASDSSGQDGAKGE